MAKKKTKRASKKDAKPSYGISDLIKELFQAAIALRGSIEPSDYKRYVLPLIFLRFLSMRFEKRRDELEAAIADPESEHHTTNAKTAKSILDDDEYRRVGASPRRRKPAGTAWSPALLLAAS